MVYDKDKMTEYKEKYRSIPENREKESQYREKVKAHRCEKMKCDNCGEMISRSNISAHKKSKKCMNHNQ